MFMAFSSIKQKKRERQFPTGTKFPLGMNMRTDVQRSARTKAKAGIDCDAGASRAAFHDGKHGNTVSFLDIAGGFKMAQWLPS